MDEPLDGMPHAPAPTAGPVTVELTYRVVPDREAAFVDAMQPVRMYRLRTGATGWRLTRSVDEPTLFTEHYTLPTWRELVRQEQERTTGEDHKLLAGALELASAHPLISRHLPA